MLKSFYTKRGKQPKELIRIPLNPRIMTNQEDQRPEKNKIRHLTGLDKANIRLGLRGTWVFNCNLDIERLKNSLRQLLAFYPYVAGRIEDSQRINLSNAGIPFSVDSQKNICIADIRSKMSLAGHFAHQPSIKKIRQGHEPAMTVRFTRIADGCVLSVFCAHGLMDGNSFYSLVSNWGCLYSSQELPAILCLDQSCIPGTGPFTKSEAIERAIAAGWSKPSRLLLLKTLPHLLSGNLLKRLPPIHFTLKALENLHEYTIRETDCQDITMNDALCAHLSLACAKLLRVPAETSCGQVIVIDARRRLGSVPDSFVGNASFIVRGTSFMPNDQLGTVAKRIHLSLRPYLMRPSKPLLDDMRLGLHLMHHRAFLTPFDLSAIYTRRPSLYYINNF